MFYKGSGGLKSMFFEVISAAQKSEEKHTVYIRSQTKHMLNKFIVVSETAKQIVIEKGYSYMYVHECE